jgi:CheY-like chemotaxis protein
MANEDRKHEAIPSAAPARKTVLVVDDDDGIRQALEQALVEEGYHVVTADNGRTALASLARLSPHPVVILLDLMMPVLDGREFLVERAREPAWAKIPVIVTTADGRSFIEAPSLGVQAVLVKPIALAKLLDTIARFG